MHPDILITGFGPFPGVRLNPASQLAVQVAIRLCRKRLNASALVLPTSYGQGLAMLERQLEQVQPRAMLMLGLAARSRFIRIERFGRDDASPVSPDAGGKMPTQKRYSSNLPWRSTASLQPALAACLSHGLRSRFSPTAGRYLCNASYALALSLMADKSVPVLFVHVPWPRGFRGLRPSTTIAAWRPNMQLLEAALVNLAQESLLRVAKRA